MSNRAKIGWLFVLPGLIGVLLFFGIPFLFTVFYTLTDGVHQLRFAGFAHFRDLLVNPAFLQAAGNSLVFILFGVPVITMLSLWISYRLSKHVARFPRWAMLVPTIVPAASAMIGWSVLFADDGVINRMIMEFGHEAMPFLDWLPTYVLLFVLKTTGYMVIVFTGALATLSPEYEAAYSLDSSSKLSFLRRIVVPQVMPVIVFVMILSVVFSFQMFREVYAVHGANPPTSLYLLQHFMSNNFLKLRYQRLSAAAMIVASVISILVAFYLRFQERRR